VIQQKYISIKRF